MNYSVWQLLVNLCRQHIERVNSELKFVMAAKDKMSVNNHLQIIAAELDLLTAILNNTNPKEVSKHGYHGSD